MTARLLDGKALAAQVRDGLRAEVAALADAGARPGLAVILAGDDPASAVYVRHKEKAAAEMWHTDGITLEQPPSFSILAAHTLPEAGGDTLFVDMGHAYRSLSPAYRRLLRGQRARHRAQRFGAGNAREVSHPLVRTIPETGERVLYLGAAPNVVDIEGMTAAESRPLLDFLFAHATRPDGMYRHRWQPGDVLMWDNRAAMHYAVHDYGDEPRDLVRMMIEGERPFEAPYAQEEA